jgi:hypothetical protein
MNKSFRLAAEEIRDLIPPQGWCIASDRITVDGCHVGFMYRDPPTEPNDSGWRFWAGDEWDSYANDPQNLAMYDVNTIANYDPAIIPLLDSPEGEKLRRLTNGALREGPVPNLLQPLMQEPVLSFG